MATIEQICEVLKAHEEGKTVQYRDIYGDWDGVNPIMCTVAFLQSAGLRVKPEPREVWMVYPTDSVGPHAYVDRSAAYGYASKYGGEVARFREVLDESE